MAEINLQVELPNSVRVKLCRIKRSSCILAIKSLVEEQAGLLPHTYRLTYLDAAPLEDGAALRALDVVGGAVLRTVAWGLWQGLVRAALQGDARGCCGEVRTIGGRGDARWRDYCAWCALFTAAHCGHYLPVCELLKEWPTIAVNAQSTSGWTALHAAASAGRWKALCVLLDHGADITVKDSRGRLAAQLAREKGHKKCEQSLQFCKWSMEKYETVAERRRDYDANRERAVAGRRAHQFTDSRSRVCLGGPRGPEYLLQTPNPVSLRSVQQFHQAREQRESNTVKPRAGRSFDYGWFDRLRAQQLVPNTHQILTYSDPSSNSLQPRSLLNPSGYNTAKQS